MSARPRSTRTLWALDFQLDATIDGRRVKLLNMIDQYTRKALAIVVDHSIDAEAVVDTRARLAIERGGRQRFVRSTTDPNSFRTLSLTGAPIPIRD